MKKIVFISFLLLLIIGACSVRDEIEIDKKAVFTSFEAQKWLNLVNGNISSLNLKSGNENLINLKANWENAIESSSDKSEIIEIPLESEPQLGFLDENAMDLALESNNFKYGNSTTRLVIQKYKKSGTITGYLMTIIGNPEYLEITDFSVKSNSYLYKEQDFSGYVLYHSLNGEFKLGWKFTNGKVTHKMEKVEGGGLNITLKSASCQYVTVYEITWHYQMVMGEEVLVNTTYEEIGSFYTCYEVDSGGGGGAPSPPGEGDGGEPDPMERFSPCPGDPMYRPEISSSGSSGKVGGMMGCTRTGGNNCTDPIKNKFHKGVDIKADLNSEFYSMLPGEVSNIRTNILPGDYVHSFGNYVFVKTELSNGETIYIQYCHLNSVNVHKGDPVKPGDLLGLTGNTGNAVDAYEDHVHINVWKENLVDLYDPIDFFATKFDQNGNVSTICNH